MSAETIGAPADTDHPSITIDTHGRIARSAVRLLDTLSYGGVRATVADDGLRASWVDPPNVGTGSVRWDFDADLDSIEAVRADGDGTGDTEFTAGIQPGVLGDRLAFARKTVGGELGDPVTLCFEDGPGEGMLRGRTRATIRRQGGPATLTRESTVRNPDPESLGGGHDTESVDPMLWRASVEPATFGTIMGAFGDTGVDHVRLRPGDADDDTARALVCEGVGDESGTDEFRVGGVVGEVPNEDTTDADDETAGSLLSLGYLTEIADALKAARMDRLVIDFRDAYPARFGFSRGGWGLSGEFWVAPRITSDDDDPIGGPP